MNNEIISEEKPNRSVRPVRFNDWTISIKSTSLKPSSAN